MPSILPAIGIVQTAEPETHLITPFQDGAKAYLAFLAQLQHDINLMIYGFTLAPAIDLLIEKKEQGIPAGIIADHTQGMGHVEKPQLQRLVDAGFVNAYDPRKWWFLLGTSPEHHAINHLKTTFGDGKYVLEGSWNYSLSASQELNVLSIIESPELVATYAKVFDFAANWIVAHESQYQVFTKEGS